jgi:hypothetical protein
MSIKIGIYDFLSSLIPGAFYLFAGIEFANIVGLYDFSLTFENLTSNQLIFSIITIVFSYILGLLMYPIEKLLWEPIFEPKNWKNRIIENFKNQFANIEIKFDENQTYTLFAFVRKINNETANFMDWYKAVSLMLRNLSFAFLLLFINQVIQLFMYNFQIINFVSGFFLILLSIVAMKYGIRFHEWFFSFLCEALIAERIEISDLVEIKNLQISKDM